MSQARPRRRQKIVDAKFQLGLGLHLIGWLYLYVVLFAVGANLPAIKSIFASDISEPDYVDAMLALRGFSRFVVVPLALTFLAMAGHAIVVTHRIAGPVYRMKMVLRQVAAGELPPSVRFRDHDYLKDLAEEATTALAALRDHRQRTQRMNAETSEALRRVLQAAKDGADAARLAALAQEALEAAERVDRMVALPEPPTAHAAPAAAESAPAPAPADAPVA